MTHLGGTFGSMSACKAGDPGLNPGPGEKFFLKLASMQTIAPLNLDDLATLLPFVREAIYL